MNWPNEMKFESFVMTLAMSNEDDHSTIISGHSTGDNSDHGPRGDYDVTLEGQPIGWLNVKINIRRNEFCGRLIVDRECPALREKFRSFIISVENQIHAEHPFSSSKFSGPFDDVLYI